MKNLLTIDLEDYYQVSGMEDVTPFESWPNLKSRIERSLDTVLESLGDTKATFFVLGWEAEMRPGLVRKVVDSGHEIATHGMSHRLITSLNRDEFRADLEYSIKLLQDISGEEIRGHRAPSFSITDKTPWAFEVMAELGLKYDSSVFPVSRSRGGISDAKLEPFMVNTQCGSIKEFPLAVWNFLGRKLPVGGGGFFRLYPYRLTKRAILEINSAGRPVVVYLHPWEFDPQQPRLKSFLSPEGFKHYYGLKSTKRKIMKLLADFDFSPIRLFKAELK